MSVKISADGRLLIWTLVKKLGMYPLRRYFIVLAIALLPNCTIASLFTKSVPVSLSCKIEGRYHSFVIYEEKRTVLHVDSEENYNLKTINDGFVIFEAKLKPQSFFSGRVYPKDSNLDVLVEKYLPKKQRDTIAAEEKLAEAGIQVVIKVDRVLGHIFVASKEGVRLSSEKCQKKKFF